MDTVAISNYDGQIVEVNGVPTYELGAYLGGGSSGVVYECLHIQSRTQFALKILHPSHLKLLRSAVLSRYITVRPEAARPARDDLEPQQTSADAAARACGGPRQLTRGGSEGAVPDEDAIRWVMHPNTKQVVATYVDARTGGLRELTLRQCIGLFGTDLDRLDRLNAVHSTRVRLASGAEVSVPRVPGKYVHFLRQRQHTCREIRNMQKIRGHANVLQLFEVLELVQEAKATLFLVLELAAGGELFDRIRVDEGCEEPVALRYFLQLLSGVAYCHARGLAHRDLKPENLLLADFDDAAVLKIADFGLSALCAEHLCAGGVSNGAAAAAGGQQQQQQQQHEMRRLMSVVGSPHYVAPEVLERQDGGYDGAKADAWSLGVILYALLNGSLPFSKDLLRCPRFAHFRAWKAHALPEHHAARRRSAQGSRGAPADSPAGRSSTARGGFAELGSTGCCHAPSGAPGHSSSSSSVGGDCLHAQDEAPGLLSAAHASPSARSFASARAPVGEPPAPFFPRRLSRSVADLLAGLLDPDPEARMTVAEAQRHPWAEQLPFPEMLLAGAEEDVDSFFDEMDDVFHEHDEEEDDEEGEVAAAQRSAMRQALLAEELEQQQLEQQQRAGHEWQTLQRAETPVRAAPMEPLCKSPAADRRLFRSVSPPSRRDLLSSEDDDAGHGNEDTARFVTDVPARTVLELLASAVASRRDGRRAEADGSKAELRVVRQRDGATLLTARVLLLRTGTYVVEFARDAQEAPAFAKYHAQLRAAVASGIRSDPALAMLV